MDMGTADSKVKGVGQPYRPKQAISWPVLLLTILFLTAVPLVALIFSASAAQKLLGFGLVILAVARLFCPDGSLPWARRRLVDFAFLLTVGLCLGLLSYPIH